MAAVIGFAMLFLISWASPAAAGGFLDYLVQLNCAGTAPQDSVTPQCWRKYDWGRYQTSDSYIRPDGAVVQTFDFAPFGTAEFGSDGGHVLKVNPNGTVVVTQTRDGGKRWEQYFVGANCFNFGTLSNGTGWIVWKADISSVPKSTVALLSSQHDPNVCPVLNKALTRYWSGSSVWFPFDLGEGLTYKNLDLIVSEHYDGSSIGSAVNMERMFFSRNAYGLIAWEAWSKTRPPLADAATRCPEVPWRHTPEADGYRLADCRVWTNITPASFIPTNFAWP